MSTERPALLIIDMVKDNFDESRHLPITPHAKKIIPAINRLIGFFRQNNFPVVFPSDAFHPDDFIFKGRMKPHSLAGTAGAEVFDGLDLRPEDYWLPKPRLSGFFQTGLEKWLKQRNITLCAIGGIATNFCVLTTVLDALCHDFKAVLLEDCAAASSEEIHQMTLSLYRKNPLYPLFRVAASLELIREFQQEA
jgi:nicotinamidase-related amidase